MAEKKFSPLVIITPLAVFLVFLIAMFFVWQTANQPSPLACTQETMICPDGSSVGRVGLNCEFAACPTANDQTAGWKNYQINASRNDGYHFSLKYPDNFFDAGHEPSTGSGICQYQSVPSVCPGINEVIGSIAGLPQASGHRLAINGTDYCHYQISDAATGHRYYTDYYWTVSGGICSTLNLETSEANCNNYLPLEQGNTEQQKNYETCIAKNTARPTTLQQIVNTLIFTK